MNLLPQNQEAIHSFQSYVMNYARQNKMGDMEAADMLKTSPSSHEDASTDVRFSSKRNELCPSK